jgi:ABC-type transport system involved in cytochrome c biogenesis permease subunit
VTLLRKGTQEPLGTYLVSLIASMQDFPEKVSVDGKTYDFSLRFKRFYKPYSVSLIDVRKEDYLGTNTPRNYSSDVHLIDPTRNVDRNIHIWMNNPLRFAGETFYQSGFQSDPMTKVESTTLSVVTNTGWMIPYVACMIVAVGMLAHFSITLSRFLSRRAEQPAGTGSLVKTGRNVKPAPVANTTDGVLATWFPVGMALAAVILFAYEARIPRAKEGEMDLYQFGKLPLVYEGRVKPFDTLARNSLRAMSDRQTFKDNNDKTQPAIRWLLDTATSQPDSRDYRVLRIDHPEVVDLLGLERRASHLYSVSEIRPKAEELEKQVDLVRDLEKKKAPLSVFQQRIMELDQRTRAFTMIHASFDALPFPPFPKKEELENDPKKFNEQIAQIQAVLDAALEQRSQLNRFMAPRPVPHITSEGGWEVYPWAATEAYLQAIRPDKVKANPPTDQLEAIFAAYERHDAPAFNAAVLRYQAALAASPPKDYEASKVDFEAFFGHFEPFFWAAYAYLFAFILAAVAWLGWSKPLNRAAFWLIVVTFVVHTFSLIGRIYISGRPPVTNLYSASVFIGFACVLLGIVLEKIYKIGIGNLLAGITGFASLFIAHLLAASGDTFTVLQAVLDTQFWLATHVVCITLGYATTYLAGILALLYVLLGVFTPYLTTEKAKDLTRMIYGGLCFAIFFSFVGTVLGGLWADDSWGRFWGWDPKENGALMIVLWNALVLHARWGGMVKDRGLALLAIVGNIMVSWSFFGVNQLGIGLHAYGSTHGVVEALVIFALTQLLIIGIGMIPQRKWLSSRSVPVPA